MRGHFAALGFSCLAAFLAGCSGGGGGGSSIPSSSPTSSASQLTLPAESTDYTQTTYTVWENTSSGTLQVGIAPIGAGAPSSASGWTVVTTGAEVFYPDGSVQLTDALGNFDASQSSWAQANAATLAANPNANPEVFIAIPFVSPQVPLDATVVAYANPNGPTEVAAVMRDATGVRQRDSGSAPVAELTSVTLYPRGVAMFDNEVRTFTLVGTDSDGDYVNLSQASIAWSLGGCGSSAGGAGQVTESSKDPARAVYRPPSSGTFSSPDLVTATVSANGTTYCATSNAFYYDVSSGVSITGILANASAQPVTNGIVSFYGGGRLFYAGNLVAVTDSTGKFARILPPNRTLTLVGGNAAVSGGRPSQATWYNLNPNSVTAGASGSTIASATYAETSQFQNPFKPLPPVDRAIRDGYELSLVGIQNFPFNRPNAQGAFKTCSIDAIINNLAGSTSCTTVTSGDYFQNWEVTNIANSGVNTSWIFTEPSSEEGGRHVLQIATTSSVPVTGGISDGNTAGLATCNAQTPCWTYEEFYNPLGFTTQFTSPITSSNGTLSGAPSGTILANDGGFNESVGSGGAFQVYMLRNEYSVGHQVQGTPLYIHTLSFNYASAGATSASVSDDWYNGAGLVEGSLQMTRTPDAGDTGFTFTATGTRTYYKSSTAAVTIGYGVNGTYNTPSHPRAGTVTVTIASVSSGDQSIVNAQAVYDFEPGGTTSCPSGYPAAQNGQVRICGQLIDPNLSNLANNLGTNVVADFTVDTQFYANVVLDANLGGQLLTFHL